MAQIIHIPRHFMAAIDPRQPATIEKFLTDCNRLMMVAYQDHGPTAESIRAAYKANCEERAQARALGIHAPDLPVPEGM